MVGSRLCVNTIGACTTTGEQVTSNNTAVIAPSDGALVDLNPWVFLYYGFSVLVYVTRGSSSKQVAVVVW